MEIVGGFMVMMSIISFFMAVVWLVMPFVVFAIKGKQDRTLEVLEAMEKRLSSIEGRLWFKPEHDQNAPAGESDASGSSCVSSCEQPIENAVPSPESAAGKKDTDTPAV